MIISTIIPCREEESFIGKCLDSIVRQDYPKDLTEIFVVDGMSTDKTREIIDKYTSMYPYVNLLNNSKGVVPTALNIGIKKAKGEYIIRMDAHTEYAYDYVSKCVEWLNKTGVENVGGPIISKPGSDTLVARAIALATSNVFGVGNSKFRTSLNSGYVDTVTFGAWPKRVFEEIGLFDERLIRNQDIELNARIRKAGGKIFLTPEIKSYYYCREDLKGLWKQNFQNGKWVIYTKAVTPCCLSWRHFIPLLFVVSLIISGLMSFVSNQFGMEKLSALCSLLFVVITVSYAITTIFFSALISFKNGLKYLLVLPIIFATLHFSYGLGSVWGLLTLRKQYYMKTE